MGNTRYIRGWETKIISPSSGNSLAPRGEKGREFFPAPSGATTFPAPGGIPSGHGTVAPTVPTDQQTHLLFEAIFPICPYSILWEWHERAKCSNPNPSFWYHNPMIKMITRWRYQIAIRLTVSLLVISAGLRVFGSKLISSFLLCQVFCLIMAQNRNPGKVASLIPICPFKKKIIMEAST